MGRSGSVGLHLKCVLSHVTWALSVGTGQAWEGQSLQGSQGPKMAKPQKYRKGNKRLVPLHLESRRQTQVAVGADSCCL